MPRTPLEPEVTQDEPTAPRPVSPDGRTLDRWGLPLGGPARAAALGGKPDPHDAPDAWAEAPMPDPTPAAAAAPATQD